MSRCIVVVVFLHSLLAGQTPYVTSIPFLENSGLGSIQGVVADAKGNVYVTGTTSGSIPIFNALQPKPGGGNCSPEPGKTFNQCPNIFVAKFDPTGTNLLYSTYLSGDQSDYAAGIAVDSSGNAYVAGTTVPAGFGPSQSPPVGNAFVKKLSADGSALLYTRYIGGSTGAQGVAVDAKGNAHVEGFSLGAFPSVNPLPIQPPVKSVYVTNDAGQTWRTLNNGLNATNINALAIDPTNPTILYAATSGGLYKSANAGATWTRLLPDVPVVDSVILDAHRRATLYVTYGLGAHLARSYDAGTTWSVLDGNFPPPSFPSPSPQLGAFAIDPTNSNVLWAIINPNRFATVIQSLDSGDHWQTVYTFPPDIFQGPTLVGMKLLIDPSNTSRIYACCIHDPFAGIGGVYRSDDGGKTWIQGAIGPLGGSAGITSPWLDPSDAGTLYGDWYYGLERSTDAGMTWAAVPLPPGLTTNQYEANGFALDAAATLYLLNDTGFLLRSADGGATWTKVTGPWLPLATILAIDPTNSSTWYVASGASLGTSGSLPQDAFVAKLDFSGNISWATPLGGSGQDAAHALALDSGGNVYVTGQTYSNDFPTVNPFQPALGNSSSFSTANAFVTKISADGSKLLYSSFLGGTGRDSGNAIAVDSTGRAYIAGGASYDLSFPIVGVPQYQPVKPNAASFLAVVDPTGGRLVNSLLLTGSPGYPASDQANAIALDQQGRVLVGGVTGDFTMPLFNPVQSTFGLGSNFIMRLDETNLASDFSTYLGDLHQDLRTLGLAPNGSLWIGELTNLVRIDFQPPTTPPGVPLVLSVNNAASLIAGDVVAPGEIVTLIGEELAPAEEAASSVPLPRSMQGVSVVIGGITAPLFYVSSSQINFQVPFELPTGSAPLSVQRGSQATAVRTVTIASSAPGIFTTAGGQPAVVHATDFSLVTQQNPAHPGEYLAVFCTGLGATSPAGASGDSALTSAPILGQAFGVFDSEAEIGLAYAGLAPGFVGLYQVNFQVSPAESPGLKHLWFEVGPNYSDQVPVPIVGR